MVEGVRSELAGGPGATGEASCWAAGRWRVDELLAEPRVGLPEPWFPALRRPELQDRCGRRRLVRCWHWSGRGAVELETTATEGHDPSCRGLPEDAAAPSEAERGDG